MKSAGPKPLLFWSATGLNGLPFARVTLLLVPAAANTATSRSLLTVVVIAGTTISDPALPGLHEGDCSMTSIGIEVFTPLYSVVTTEAKNELLKVHVKLLPGASLASVMR